MKYEIGTLTAETRHNKSEVIEEEKRIYKMKEDIKKFNKLITDTQVIKFYILFYRKKEKILKMELISLKNILYY